MIVDLLEPLGLFLFSLQLFFSPLFCLDDVVSSMDLNHCFWFYQIVTILSYQLLTLDILLRDMSLNLYIY